MPIKPRLEKTNIIWKIFLCWGSLSKKRDSSMPTAIKTANMPRAIRPTMPMVSRETSPTELAQPDRISRGLKMLTIILLIWPLVCSSNIPFLAAKNPVPIIISRESIWKNTVNIVMEVSLSLPLKAAGLNLFLQIQIKLFLHVCQGRQSFCRRAGG